MGETPDQIERHISEERSELGENIHELQRKVKTAMDWRAQFDQRPWVLMGVAFGGGLLLSLLLGARGTPVPRVIVTGPAIDGEVSRSAPAFNQSSATTKRLHSGKTFEAQR